MRKDINESILDLFIEVNELPSLEGRVQTHINSEGYYTKYVVEIYHPHIFFKDDEVNDEQIRH